MTHTMFSKQYPLCSDWSTWWNVLYRSQSEPFHGEEHGLRDNALHHTLKAEKLRVDLVINRPGLGWDQHWNNIKNKNPHSSYNVPYACTLFSDSILCLHISICALYTLHLIPASVSLPLQGSCLYILFYIYSIVLPFKMVLHSAYKQNSPTYCHLPKLQAMDFFSKCKSVKKSIFDLENQVITGQLQKNPNLLCIMFYFFILFRIHV